MKNISLSCRFDITEKLIRKAVKYIFEQEDDANKFCKEFLNTSLRSFVTTLCGDSARLKKVTENLEIEFSKWIKKEGIETFFDMVVSALEQDVEISKGLDLSMKLFEKRIKKGK